MRIPYISFLLVLCKKSASIIQYFKSYNSISSMAWFLTCYTVLVVYLYEAATHIVFKLYHFFTELYKRTPNYVLKQTETRLTMLELQLLTEDEICQTARCYFVWTKNNKFFIYFIKIGIVLTKIYIIIGRTIII